MSQMSKKFELLPPITYVQQLEERRKSLIHAINSVKKMLAQAMEKELARLHSQFREQQETRGQFQPEEQHKYLEQSQFDGQSQFSEHSQSGVQHQTNGQPQFQNREQTQHVEQYEFREHLQSEEQNESFEELQSEEQHQLNEQPLSQPLQFSQNLQVQILQTQNNFPNQTHIQHQDFIPQIHCHEVHYRIVPHANTLQFYRITQKGDSQGKYISVQEREAVIASINAGYNKKALSSMEKELRKIEKLLAFTKKHSVELVYDHFSENRKSVVQPVTVTQIEYAQRWLQQKYQGKDFEDGSPQHFTAAGERVRSKSEVIIADTLNRLKIPYRYEMPLKLKGRTDPVYPDFYCLNTNNRREVIWEHFGLMDNPEYAQNAVAKINAFARNGFFPGVNAIFTFETADCPITVKAVELQCHLLIR